MAVASMPVNHHVAGIGQPSIGVRTAAASQPQTTTVASVPTPVTSENKVLDKRRLQELVKEVDPLEQLDEDVEEVCCHFTDVSSIHVYPQWFINNSTELRHYLLSHLTFT